MEHTDIERLMSSSDMETNWSWNRQAGWLTEAKDARMQQLYTKWRSDPFRISSNFPHTLGLRVDSRGSLLPFHPEDTVDTEIVVTQAYENTYNRILTLRGTKSKRRAVVLTGQPGVGKTTFLKYMLVRLISARQVVLLLDRQEVTLFYAGKVYYRAVSDGLLHIPKPAGKNIYPAWALIDVDWLDSGPPLSATSEVWPIQASSPNSVQWKSWSKQFDAAEWGMPLWTMGELLYGLRLQRLYTDFRNDLENALRKGSIPSSTTGSEKALVTCNKAREDALVAALEVLKKQALDDSDNTVEADREASMITDVDCAIDHLVSNAIADYGFAPQVVYAAIFEPSVINERHERAIDDLSYSALETLIKDLRRDGSLSTDVSHYLISVSPIMRYARHPLDNWLIDFKSIRIAKRLVVEMMKKDDQRLREMYSFFNRMAETSGLAGWVFEALAHRTLCKASNSVAASSGVMYSNEKETPTFSVVIPSSASATLHLPALSILDNGRNETLIDLTRSLDDFQAESDIYYILEATNNPLFDSFTITFNPSQSTALISVFQMTISETHCSSSKGYSLIRKIMGRVRRLNPSLEIKVAYWLVCPAAAPSESKERLWKMPNEWDTHTKVNDHRGHVYCLYIPVGI